MELKIVDKYEISFFVPCYNEEKNILNTLNNIKEACKDINHEILIVDDGSIDSTAEIVKKYIAKSKSQHIRLFVNKKNYGLGFSYFKYSMDAQGKYYMLINGDNVEPAESIEKIISFRGNADLIVPFFDKKDKRNLFRRTLSLIFTLIVNVISLNTVKYYNGPVLHKTKNVQLYRSVTFGYGYQAELVCKLIALDYTYLNIEISNTDRQFGTTKAFSLENFLSVTNSLIIIFFGTISTILRKIFRYGN